MARPKFILQRIAVDEAQRAYNCQHNSRHRLERGDRRLNIWKGRTPERYCVACALDMIKRDMAKLQEIAAQLVAHNE